MTIKKQTIVMKKNYMQPAAQVVELNGADAVLLDGSPTGPEFKIVSTPGEEVNAGLTRGRCGWNSELWSLLEEE